MIKTLARLFGGSTKQTAGQKLDLPILNELPLEDPRRQSLGAFITWAEQCWTRFEEVGPLTPPIQRFAHAKAGWIDNVANVYGALYPARGFADYHEFLLFNRFSSSIHQIQYQGAEVDMSWFCPEPFETAMENHITFLKGIDRLASSKQIEAVLLGWRLPSQFEWVATVQPRRGFVFQDEAGGDVLAETDSGYLHCFAQDDGFDAEFPPLQ